ncbi:MAG: cyclic nucleotide-binding domain-containing protein [Candidatus Mcinerneyibacterium aminivorans]|uniref:Cyclic nucleotide-binding domain-containing protein n=1 Tax=Candidatus Mcinerneyibacterium aminivorans TaxID=2703815 RepID=A0A5D0MIB2_9BACT|nr:MAG: cyclic nucleotide-binding domain-containing protein [Candidatus Mcinerneyibacterium aminivorans]
MEKIEVLKNNYLFKNIPVSYFPKITSYFSKIDIQDDKKLFEEGDRGDFLYLIGKGKVSIIINIENIGQEGIAVLTQNEFFGEMSILDGGRRSATAIAREETVLLKINRENFLELLDKKADYSTIILRNLVEKISKRIKNTSEKLNSFYLMNMEG